MNTTTHKFVFSLEARCPRCKRWHGVETRKNRKDHATASGHGAISLTTLASSWCHGGERWPVKPTTPTRLIAYRHEKGKRCGGDWTRRGVFLGEIRQGRGMMSTKPTADDREEARGSAIRVDAKKAERRAKITARLATMTE